MNVYFFNTGNQELTGPVFPGDSEPASIDAIIPSPTSTLVAIQTTGTDGDADTWLIDSKPQAEMNLTNVGPNDGVDGDFFVSWSPAGDSLLVRLGTDASMFFVTNFSRNIIPIDPNPIYQGDRNAGTSPAWSADSSLISYFDNDPADGGQLRIARVDGSPLCDPIATCRQWSGRRSFAVVDPDECAGFAAGPHGNQRRLLATASDEFRCAGESTTVGAERWRDGAHREQ